MHLNKVTLCFCFGGSRQSLKVREVKCVPGDPAIMCPVLFKGSRSLLLLALALRSLLYVPSLSHKAVLSILLAVLCYACGYGIVCLSSGLCGSIFIYYKQALRIYGYVYNLTLSYLKRQTLMFMKNTRHGDFGRLFKYFWNMNTNNFYSSKRTSLIHLIVKREYACVW